MTAQFPGPPSQEDRLSELERRVGRIEEALREGPKGPAGTVAGHAPQDAVSPELESPVEPASARSGASTLALEVLARTGWTVLTLAGAFLVRAMTDRGAMATAPGVALGLAYALGIIVVADRAAARGNRLTAAFLGSTGVFIADAIVAETTTRFAIFSVGAGLAILALATGFGLALARRDDLPAIAWTTTLAACATGVYLAVNTGQPAPAGLLLLGLSAAASWRPDRWTWQLLPWPPTLCAVGLSLWATASALGPAPTEATGSLLPIALALGLVILWPGSILLRTLLGHPQVSGVAIAQAILALAVGLRGALGLIRAAGGNTALLAAAALACGAGSYALAFRREREPGTRVGRLYWAWFGLALVVIGSDGLLRAPAPALLWALLGLVVAAASLRFEPVILQPQAAVFATAAMLASGMLRTSLFAFGAPENALAPVDAPALLTLAAAAGVAGLLIWQPPAAGPLPAFTAALFSAIGLGAVAVLGLRRPAAALLAAPLPALRTVVVSVSAYALARLWRVTSRRELRTLAYLALVIGGVKLLIEDLPSGTPMTLFVAFVFYGGALLLIPRLMSRGGSVPASRRSKG